MDGSSGGDVPSLGRESFDELCKCEEDRACEEEWVQQRMEPAMYACAGLLFFQFILGWVSWYVAF